MCILLAGTGDVFFDCLGFGTGRGGDGVGSLGGGGGGVVGGFVRFAGVGELLRGAGVGEGLPPGGGGGTDPGLLCFGDGMSRGLVGFGEVQSCCFFFSCNVFSFCKIIINRGQKVSQIVLI